MPPLHSFLVHFPIALLFMAWGCDLIAVLGKRPEFSRAAWLNQIAGTLGVIGAVGSGLWAKGMLGAGLPPEADVALHEQLAFAASAAALVLLFWRIARRGSIRPGEQWSFLLLFTLAVALIAVTGYFGGMLVVHPGG